jgi:raffinose/stachyose/melibiose transport system permease protein
MTRANAERIANYAILVGFSVIAIYPLFGIFFVALAPAAATTTGILPLPSHVVWGNFSQAWNMSGLGPALENSAIIASTVVALASLLSILAGYALGTLKPRGSGFLFYVFIAGLIMPYEAMIIPLYYDMRGVGLTGSYWSLILPESGLYLAFGIFWMRAFFRAVPQSLLDAARIDGASSWTILWRVLLPFGRPAVFTMMVLFFIWSWNEFLLPLVMLAATERQTATLALVSFQGQHITELSLQTAAALIVAVPVLIVYVIFQRQFIRGMLSGALKG